MTEHKYLTQLKAARALVEAFDAHKANRKALAAGEIDEAAELTSFERVREARHALYDVCREVV